MGPRFKPPSIPLQRNTACKKLKKQIIKCWELYLFLLIPLSWLIIFCYVPMTGIQLAFRKFTIQGGIWNSPWVGLDNFRRFFNSPQLGRILPNTIILSFYSLIAGFPLPVIFALCLNSLTNQFFKKTVQNITYMPHFISTVVLVGMIYQIFNNRIGLYGTIYYALTGSYPKDIFASASAFRHIYVWSGIWQHLGWNSIIYLAALTSVDPELHDSAQIDGASRFQRLLYIDLPTIIPTITIMLILNSGHIMSVGFEKVYLLQNQLNITASEVISTYVYKVGLASGGQSDYSYSTAIGLFNSIVNMLMLATVNYIAKKTSTTYLW